MSEGLRRSSDRYPGASGRCQKGPAVAVTDIQGVQDDVSGGPPGSDRYPGGPGRCQREHRENKSIGPQHHFPGRLAVHAPAAAALRRHLLSHQRM
eukprot:gene11402-biopygen4852